MLKYLIIQLDDTSVSFCHYNNYNITPRLIDVNVLKEALFWSMKENLTVQLLFPDYELPYEYKALISEVDHSDIVFSKCQDLGLKESADVVVFDSWAELACFEFIGEQVYVIRTFLSDLFTNENTLKDILSKVARLNVMITDIEKFDRDAEKSYYKFLDNINDVVLQEYQNGHNIQLNILTDRLMLDAMNNCGAGEESITLAPDGKFYICPGFYLDGSKSVGDVATTPDIKNPQLYKLDHAPICRICDAWQCKRCVWLNKRLTLEVNTPSHEQCVVAHIERNASRKLLENIRKIGTFMPGKTISELPYLDPFDKITINN